MRLILQSCHVISTLSAPNDSTITVEGKPEKAKQGEYEYVLNKVVEHTVENGKILHRVR